jgi:hypothetical protein
MLDQSRGSLANTRGGVGADEVFVVGVIRERVIVSASFAAV